MNTQNINILLVDDDPDYLDMLTEVICEMGPFAGDPESEDEIAFKPVITTCLNAASALTKISSNNFDIMFCDYSMPGSNGKRLAKKITDDKLNIKIAIVSGADPEVLGDEFFGLSVDEIFSKSPLDPIRLFKLLKSICSQKKQENQELSSYSNQELGHIRSLLSQVYSEHDKVYAIIKTSQIPIEMVEKEIVKKRQFGNCSFDSPASAKKFKKKFSPK